MGNSKVQKGALWPRERRYLRTCGVYHINLDLVWLIWKSSALFSQLCRFSKALQPQIPWSQVNITWYFAFAKEQRGSKHYITLETTFKIRSGLEDTGWGEGLLKHERIISWDPLHRIIDRNLHQSLIARRL